MNRRRLFFWAWGLVLLGWLGYGLLGNKLSQMLAARFGSALLRFGQGKFTDATVFVQHRWLDLLWLATLAVGFGSVQFLLATRLETRTRNCRCRWAVLTGAAFVWLNLWLAAAGNTALFWGVVGTGAGLQNLTQYELKRILLEENPAPVRAVLMGSSQTRAQIDEDLLNQILGTNLWTTELHFPGSHGYDLLVIERQLRRSRARFAICYLSEGYFYNGSVGEILPNFFGFCDLPDFIRRGAGRYLLGEGFCYGLLGDLLPLFRYREPLAQRFLGERTVQLKQSQHDASLKVDLEARAQELAGSCRRNGESEFQKRAFEDFVARCQRSNRQVIALAGQFNPILGRKLDPTVRSDMLSFLETLRARYPNLIVVGEGSMPLQTPAEYADLTHVKPEAQRRFTVWLAGFLETLLSAKPPAFSGP
jgi:hypothetical protein